MCLFIILKPCDVHIVMQLLVGKSQKLVMLEIYIFLLVMFKIVGYSYLKLLHAFFKDTFKKTFSEVKTICPLTVGLTFGNRQK